jgi:hypothetical protein
MIGSNLYSIVHAILDELIGRIDQQIADIMSCFLGRQVPCLDLIPIIARG